MKVQSYQYSTVYWWEKEIIFDGINHSSACTCCIYVLCKLNSSSLRSHISEESAAATSSPLCDSCSLMTKFASSALITFGGAVSVSTATVSAGMAGEYFGCGEFAAPNVQSSPSSLTPSMPLAIPPLECSVGVPSLSSQRGASSSASATPAPGDRVRQRAL